MRDVRTTRIRLVGLALLLAGLLGYQCGGTEAQQAWVVLVPNASSLETHSPLIIDVSLTSSTPIQAFEVSLQWDPAMLSGIHVLPHPEFDDDGMFFTSPLWNGATGQLSGIADLRHGGTGVSGNFKVATVWFMTRGSPGSTSIQITGGGLADGSGNEPPVSGVPVTITIQP